MHGWIILNSDGEKSNNKRFYPNLEQKRIFNSVEDENLVIFAEVQIAFKIDIRIFKNNKFRKTVNS